MQKPPTVTFRDPIHGFIRADPLEAALINSRPVQRLRSIHQLGFTYLVFPGAEHSRFSHALGTMELAGRVFDALAAKGVEVLPPERHSYERRRVRAAALLHDIGHPPYSHSGEERFEEGIEHEEMTHRLMATTEIRGICSRYGDGIQPEDLSRLLLEPEGETEQLLSKILSGDLDVDKMDYLLRDSLYCGVRYGSYDLARLLDTILPLQDPHTGDWGIGVAEGGVHALEALVMARYYMFTQVYFNVTGKALELHFNEWLQETDQRWPVDPEAFLLHDDITTLSNMRSSDHRHARAVTERVHFPLAFETDEHLAVGETRSFEALLPALREEFGSDRILVSHAAKDPHSLSRSRLLVRGFDGTLESMEKASHFIGHLARIERFRIYTSPEIRDEVARTLRSQWQA